MFGEQADYGMIFLLKERKDIQAMANIRKCIGLNLDDSRKLLKIWSKDLKFQVA